MSLPVLTKSPELKFLVIPPIFTPRPICLGFVPPPSVVAALPYDRVFEYRVSNVMFAALKAVVLMFATLFAITLICC